MANEAIESNQRKMTRIYIRRISNLIKLGRFTEASSLTMRFNGILMLWDLQQQDSHDAAVKDGCELQRKTLLNQHA